jgi:3-methyl-2-oxobutanoate hydroxymethyltransferase
MKIDIRDLQSRKKRTDKIVMLTSYDYPSAVMEDELGIDIQLVGDSVGTNMLGYKDVSEVTVTDIAHHVRAVARGAQRSFVLCDMPYKSFETCDSALQNARFFMDNGANGLKIEGEEEAMNQIRHVASHGIPVCAHIGYTPQTDGIKATVQGKDFERARGLISIALSLEKAGASMIVLELIPEGLATVITELLSIPTIGIGAGRFCDGQVQVVNDILGLTPRVFRHAKAYANLRDIFRSAVGAYIEDVKTGGFPTEKNASSLPADVLEQVQEWISRQGNISK